MKNLFISILTLSIFTNSVGAQSRNGIIVYIENVQGGIVGKTVSTYKNGQTLFGNKLPNIVTVDEPSSTNDTKEFKKEFTLGISSLLTSSNLKDFKVEATTVQITNVNNDVESLPTGSRIVMNGFKADSVTITMTKKEGFRLSLSQLFDKIKKYAPISEASALNAISLIDSANYQNNKTITIVIKNPKVYYAMIVGQIKSEFAKNAYLDIPSALERKTKIDLNNVSGSILPQSSSSFSEIGFARRILFSARQNDSGVPEFYIQATKEEGGVDEVKVSKVGNNWNATGILFKSIVLGKVTKKYYVDISAVLSADGKSITITRGEIRYPEWVFNGIPKKKLEE